MRYSADQEELLAKLAEAILDAFESIARAAEAALGLPLGSVDELLPAKAQQNLQQIRTETRISLSRLLREPAIARVSVHWPDTDTTEQIYISRGSSAGMLASLRLVSYRAPLGRLAEIPAGETEEIVLPRGRRLVEIAKRSNCILVWRTPVGTREITMPNLLSGRS